MNVEKTIRRELELAWQNGKNAGVQAWQATMAPGLDGRPTTGG